MADRYQEYKEYQGDISYGDGSKGIWKILITLVVGVVIGFGGATLWIDRDGGEEGDTDSLSNSNGITVPTVIDEEEPQSISDNDEILIKDQNAGEFVFISRVSLSKVGWVAVREGVDGELGNVLGARILDAGSYQGEQIGLLRATLPNHTYYSVLYHDNGDRKFSFSDDLQVVDENGVLIITSFETYDSSDTDESAEGDPNPPMEDPKDSAGTDGTGGQGDESVMEEGEDEEMLEEIAPAE